MDGQQSFKNVGDIIGGCGKWQMNIFFFDFIINLLSTMNALSQSFMAPKLKYWCTQQYTTNYFSKCEFMINSSTSTACEKWTFDTSVFKTTIVSEWDLVCKNEWIASFSTSLFMIGYFVSSFLSGHLSDRFGRIPILKVAVVVEFVAGISCAFSLSVIQYLVSRFFLGIASYAKFLTGFTLLVESVATNYRSTYGIMSRSGRSFGHIILPIVAWFLPNFRHLQIAITIPGALMGIWLLTIPESPRWLLVHRSVDDVEAVVTKAMKMNGKKDENTKAKLTELQKSIQLDDEKKKGDFLDLWRTTYLRKNTTIMCINWFVTIFIYYALSFNVQDLGGNLFVNYIISGAVELPAILLCTLAMKHFGRRSFLSACEFGIFLAFISGAVLSKLELERQTSIRVALAMFGKFCVTCAFSINYIMSSEMYPTVVRQIGVGTNSAAGRLGSMLSPFIKEVNSKFDTTLSFVLFAGISLFDAIIVRFLPETKGKDIPDTIEQVENRKSSDLKLEEIKYEKNDVNK